MKKKRFSLFLVLCTLTLFCTMYLIRDTNANQPTSFGNIKTNSIGQTSCKFTLDKIPSLKELKKRSDLIVEVVGTGTFTEREYKGLVVTISDVSVSNVIKGDKNISSVKILAFKDSENQIQAGDRLVMFLRKGIDNPDCYVPIGTSLQGAYKKSLDNASGKIVLKQFDDSFVNKELLNELSGDFDNVKKKLEIQE